jgi:hypothetical protein
MYYQYTPEILEDLLKVILEERVKSICINDTPNCSEEEYEYAAKTIRETFEKKFPQKSMFEK